jgi:hypothetical protein|tara:strand:+ start:3830 stop:5926 length:2097 start_codon:yes stop_codon:yes gene_type:complete
MLNMIDTQDKLKNFSEDQLIQEMQRPSGSAPQFMVLGEIDRRKRMRADAQRQEGLMQPTVAQESVNGAGVPQQGIAGIAQSLAPQTDMTQNTGVGSVQEPTRMAEGGALSAGTMSAIAQLKVTQPELYARVKDDPEALKIAAESFLNVAKDAENTALEGMSAPRENDLLKRMFTDPTRGMIREQQKRDAGDFGAGYALDQRAKSLSNQAGLPANAGILSEGAPVEYVSRTSGPTPGGIVGGGMFEMSEPPETDETTRPYFPIAPEFDGIKLPSALQQVKPPSGSGANPMPVSDMDSAPDASALTDEQARRLYLSGRDYEGGDVPAIVDMLNRGREFQQSDTTVPREQIYDLGPRGRLQYEGASDEEFTSTADRLAREQFDQENRMSGASLGAQDVAADAPILAEIARQAEARRMRRINEIPETGYRSMARKKKEADFTAAHPFFTGVIDPIIGASIDAGGLAGRTVAGMFEVGVDFDDKVKRKRADEAEETLMGMPVTAGGIGTLKTAEEAAAEAKRAAEIATRAGGGTKTSGGGGAGTTSATTAKVGEELTKREKAANQDKWLALAQAGFTLMSTGDFGKAGQTGIAAYAATKKGEQAYEMDMMKLQAELALRNAQMSAANRSGRGGSGSGLSANQMLSRGNDLIKSGQNMLEAAGDNADAAGEAEAIMAAGRNLVRQAIGGTAPVAPAVTKAPSAT